MTSSSEDLITLWFANDPRFPERWRTGFEGQPPSSAARRNEMNVSERVLVDDVRRVRRVVDATAREIRDALREDGEVTLRSEGRGLKNRDGWFGWKKSDPCVEWTDANAKKTKRGVDMVVYRSETARNASDPNWKAFSFGLDECVPDATTNLKSTDALRFRMTATVWDVDPDGEHDLIGETDRPFVIQVPYFVGTAGARRRQTRALRCEKKSWFGTTTRKGADIGRVDLPGYTLSLPHHCASLVASRVATLAYESARCATLYAGLALVRSIDVKEHATRVNVQTAVQYVDRVLKSVREMTTGEQSRQRYAVSRRDSFVRVVRAGIRAARRRLFRRAFEKRKTIVEQERERRRRAASARSTSALTYGHSSRGLLMRADQGRDGVGDGKEKAEDDDVKRDEKPEDTLPSPRLGEGTWTDDSVVPLAETIRGLTVSGLRDEHSHLNGTYVLIHEYDNRDRYALYVSLRGYYLHYTASTWYVCEDHGRPSITGDDEALLSVPTPRTNIMSFRLNLHRDDLDSIRSVCCRNGDGTPRRRHGAETTVTNLPCARTSFYRDFADLLAPSSMSRRGGPKERVRVNVLTSVDVLSVLNAVLEESPPSYHTAQDVETARTKWRDAVYGGLTPPPSDASTKTSRGPAPPTLHELESCRHGSLSDVAKLGQQLCRHLTTLHGPDHWTTLEGGENDALVELATSSEEYR